MKTLFIYDVYVKKIQLMAVIIAHSQENVLDIIGNDEIVLKDCFINKLGVVTSDVHDGETPRFVMINRQVS